MEGQREVWLHKGTWQSRERESPVETGHTVDTGWYCHNVEWCKEEVAEDHREPDTTDGDLQTT